MAFVVIMILFDVKDYRLLYGSILLSSSIDVLRIELNIDLFTLTYRI